MKTTKMILRSISARAALLLLLPMTAFADIPEPVLVPPVKKIVRTSFVSCALDSEAIKCWGPIYDRPKAKASSVIDFKISDSGYLIILLKNDDNSADVDGMDYGQSGYRPHHTIFIPSRGGDRNINNKVYHPKEIYWKYSDLNIFCIRGEDSAGISVEVCNGDYAESVVYADEASKDVSFDPCILNINVNLTQASPENSCKNIERRRGTVVPNSGAVDRALYWFGVKHWETSPFELKIEGHKYTICFDDGTPKAHAYKASVGAGIPANARYYAGGVSKVDLGKYDPDKAERLLARIIPETECTQIRNVSYSTLSPKWLLSSKGYFYRDEEILNKEYSKLLQYELGITNLSVYSGKVSFTDLSKKVSLNFALQRIDSKLEPREIMYAFFQRFRAYNDFYVFYDEDYYGQGTFKIFDTKWKEILEGSNHKNGDLRRTFKIGKTNYKCVGLTCYKITKQK